MKRLLAAVLITLIGGLAMAEIVVSPDSEKIRYMGRVDFTDPKAPRFDWSGIEISVNFTGS